MKKKISILLLLLVCLSVQAQKIAVNKTDNFTKSQIVYTSYEKISSEPLIMGGQLGKNIWVCFGRENGLNMIMMKWLTVDNRYVRKDSNVIFLDEEDNTHTFTVSDYASGRGVGTVGALGMDLWGIQLLLLGDLSAFENHTMKSVRIYTVDGYFDFKIKNGASKKLMKAYNLFKKAIK